MSKINKKLRKITNAESHSKKKKTTIMLPAKFKNFISDPKIQAEFMDFARKKDTRPSYGELTSYGNGWITGMNGKSYNPDDVSINTYMLMRMDAQIQIGLKVIKLPIKAMKWWVVSQDENIKAFIHYNLRIVWQQMMSAILNALDFGWSATEKIWEVQDVDIQRREGEDIITAYKGKAILLKKLKDADPMQVTILADSNGDFAGFEQSGSVAGGTATVPAEKSFIYTNEKEFGNLYGKSLLRYSYDYWYWATLMYQFINRYFERRGTPPVLARAPGGRTNLNDGTVLDNLVLAQRAGESLTESSVVALPSNTDEKGMRKWDLEYMKDDQRADMFMRYIEHLNAMKLRGLFVPERMIVQDTEMGAKAVASTHLDVFLMGLEGLTKDIIDHINKYIIPQLIKYNFGEDAPKAYLETSGLSTESKNMLKQIIITAMKQGNGNIPLDMVKALEELNLPIGKFGSNTDNKVEDDTKPNDNDDDEDEDDDEDNEEDADTENVNLSAIKKLLKD